MKNATLKVGEEEFEVRCWVDADRGGTIMSDSTATMLQLVTLGGEAATLYPDKGDPIPIYLMSGKVSLGVDGNNRSLRFIYRNE